MNKQVYEKEHASIISKVLDLELADDKASMLNFESGENVDFTTYVKLNVTEDIFIVLTLPTDSNKVFFTVTDGNPEIIAFLLSEIERTDLTKGFGMRDTIRFNHEYLIENDKVGVMLLPISVSNVLSEITEIKTLSGKPYELYLCTFISADDYACNKNLGSDALMDKFSRENKDLISIR